MIDFRAMFRPGPAEARALPLDLPGSAIEVAAALKGADHFVFLDSADTLGGRGEFSILAWEPKLIFRSKDETVQIRRDGRWFETRGHPFDALTALMNAALIRGMRRPELPFVGGAIGYFAYDLFRFLEHYDRLTAADDLGLPDCCLAFYDSALIHQHRENRWFLAGVSAMSSGNDIRGELERKRDRVHALVESETKKSERRGTPAGGAEKIFISNFTKKDYLKAVDAALEHIFAGDIYQVNLSQRFRTTLENQPFDLFRTLRSINPSKYAAYLKYDGHAVISSSPELFLTTAGRRVETRPIKGTRPRGRTPEEDARLRLELQNSAKDRAELSMIVDLERNDLGRVCEYGSVQVREHASIDELPTVFHTVSTVQGVLRDGVGPIELLRATFPGGSVTGCPKIRSIQVIDELEPTCRNVYTGSIGFIDFGGDLTLNIPIRTLIAKGGEVFFQAGGGIVADSEPEAEYAETLDKAKAMMNALRLVDQDHE